MISPLCQGGWTTREIVATFKEMYGADVSASLISKVTDAVIEQVTQWQSRPLESIYPIVYLDCIMVKIRKDGGVINQAIYLALGINDAIQTVYPQTQIQLCIVHMVRNSVKYVPWKDYKAVTADLKTIYQAATEEQALQALTHFSERWDA